MNQLRRRLLEIYFGVKPGNSAKHSRGEETMYDYTQLDHVVVANPAKIPCSLRTLKPYYANGPKPYVHVGQLGDAILYLASRADLPPEEIRALRELLERLSSLLTAQRDAEKGTPPGEEWTNDAHIVER